jgi:hypothetical protein
LDATGRAGILDAAEAAVRARHDVHAYTEAYLRLMRALVKDPGTDLGQALVDP